MAEKKAPKVEPQKKCDRMHVDQVDHHALSTHLIWLTGTGHQQLITASSLFLALSAMGLDKAATHLAGRTVMNEDRSMRQSMAPKKQ